MEQFNDGRYEALGRAIYRAMQFDPKAPVFKGADLPKLLNSSFDAILPFLQMRIEQQEKEIANSTATELPTRKQDLQSLQDETRWVKATQDWLNELGKMSKINAMDQSEIKK